MAGEPDPPVRRDETTSGERGPEPQAADPLESLGTALESFGTDEVRDRAVGGAAVLGGRGVVVYALGIGANIALARLLSPRDFGLVALGSILLVVGTYLTDGGLGAALIRRERPPERVELEAVAGLQLGVAAAIAALGTAIALFFGDDGLVVAVMLASLPVASARLPAAIVLERRLTYRPIALVDLVEAVSYYVWALVAVVLGAGIWGLASAVVVRAWVGMFTMMKVGPVGFVRPRWSWLHVRPIVSFGAKLQATTVVAIVRDQGLNIGVAGIAGIAALGVWSLAYRILQVPMLLVTTAARVAFPTMSRMMASREDPRALIERGVATGTVVMAIVLVALVGSAPAALPALLGNGWAAVPPTLLWSALGMLLGAPVAVATIGYLFAVDRAGMVVWAVVWQMLAWFAVTLPLLPSLGAPAVGVGWVPAGVVLAAILGRRAETLTGASIARNLAIPAAVAVAAGAAGWAIAASGPETLLGGAAGLVTGEIILLVGLALAKRSALIDAYALAARAVKSTLAQPPATRETPVS
jgi:polysaccharide transporter, PST family